MKYCTRCVMPDSKPDLFFDEEGVCSACRSFENRVVVDWKKRKQELKDILARHSKRGKWWDCVVPVSGGKDSTFQVVRLLELGMNPLCVTATTCDISDVGERNIENLKRLGVDYIEFTTNRQVRKKLNRIGLRMVGDISWPEHVSIFTIPVRVAVQYNIPLIVWGENSQNEYGGPAAASENHILDRRWLEEFGGLLGLRVSDLVGLEGIEERDLLPYTYPTDEELARVGVTGIFLGYFLPWDGLTNALYAQAHGFETHHKNIETTFLNYDKLDNLQAGIHDYFKFIKFGYGRATDHACLHLRRGRIDREDACRLVRVHDGRFPSSFLDVPLETILGKIEMSVEEFEDICDRFTNKKLFKTDKSGKLLKDAYGNLKRIYYPDGEVDA